MLVLSHFQVVATETQVFFYPFSIKKKGLTDLWVLVKHNLYVKLL